MLGQLGYIIPPSNGLNSPIRTFVFDNQNTFSSLSIQSSINLTTETVDLSQVLSKFEKQRSNPHEHYQYRIFNPATCQYVTISQSRCMASQFFITPIIMIKYSKVVGESDVESSSSLLSTESKKQRNKERTIREVIESVKRWRDMHNSPANDRNRVSLQEAAKIIGISKKSLDDYFYQLRLGEQYGFDFQSHMEDKVGVLRAFVRKHKPNKECLKDRKPRRLKLLEDMGYESEERKEIDENGSEQKNMMEEEIVETMDPEPGIYNIGDLDSDKIVEQEQKFYQNFDFEDPYDMFVTFKQKDFVDGDFHKKASDFDDLDLMPW